MAGAGCSQNPSAPLSGRGLKMGPFDTYSGILNTQIGDLPFPISMVAFGLAAAPFGRVEILEREP